jgi:hypothetical protein
LKTKVIRQSGRFRRAAALRSAVLIAGAFGLVQVGAGIAQAAESDVVVAIDCQRFDPEARAAVEARARAELIVRGATGTLVVACDDTRAELTWHPLIGAPSATTAFLAPEARTAIEHILEALDALLGAPRAAEPASASPPPAPAGPPTSPPPSPEDADETRRAPPDDSASTARTRSPGFFRGMVLFAGAHGELWSRVGALGPSARVEAALPLRLGAFLSGTALWALSSPENVDARLVRLAAGGAFGIDRDERFRVGLDAFVDLVHARAAGSGSDDKTVGGATLFATAAFPFGPLRLEVGPTLAFRPRELQVRVGAMEALHISPFAVGLSLGVAFGPLR